MNDKYIITPYRAHIEGLEYDLKVYKKTIKSFNKNSPFFNPPDLSDYLEASAIVNYIEFLLKEEITGNVYEVDGEYRFKK